MKTPNTHNPFIKPTINVWDIDGCKVEPVKLIFDKPNAEALNFETIKNAPLREAYIKNIFLPNYRKHDWVFTGRKRKTFEQITYQLYLRIFNMKYLPQGAERLAKQLLAHTVFYPDDKEFGKENEIYHQWKYNEFAQFNQKHKTRYQICAYDDDIKLLELISPILSRQGQLNLVGKQYCLQIVATVPFGENWDKRGVSHAVL